MTSDLPSDRHAGLIPATDNPPVSPVSDATTPRSSSPPLAPAGQLVNPPHLPSGFTSVASNISTLPLIHALPSLSSPSPVVNPKQPHSHKPSFCYDLDVLNQCMQYLNDKNHHGLALISRQKGIPPFLRFKVWPILLKYHPFVLNPFLQPDNEVINEHKDGDSPDSSESTPSSHPDDNLPTNSSNDAHTSSEAAKDDILKTKIRKDLKKYIQRIKFSSSHHHDYALSQDSSPSTSTTSPQFVNSAYGDLTQTEVEIFAVLENSIFKFISKWGKIIKYDQALTWIALGLAEWLPPLPHTSLVLLGRDSSHGGANTNNHANGGHKGGTPLSATPPVVHHGTYHYDNTRHHYLAPGSTIVKNLFDDYSNYIGNVHGLSDYLENLVHDDTLTNLTFHDVYERLVLVILHSPEERTRKMASAHANSSYKSSRRSSHRADRHRNSHAHQSHHYNHHDRTSSSRHNHSRPERSKSASDTSSASANCDLESIRKQAQQVKHNSEDDNDSAINNTPDEDLSGFKIDKTTLPISGGTIEERVSFFIYILRKLLPELSQFFQEEQILNKFGSSDDEWLIWWLKYGGAKVWSPLDRGRIWDSILGWRVPNKKNERKNKHYYRDKLNISDNVLTKLGPDIFWSVDTEDDIVQPENDGKESGDASPKSSLPETIDETSSNGSHELDDISDEAQPIPFSKIDPHIELIFIALALLKSKENTLVELDQHEVRQYLSRLPTKSYSRSDKYKQYKEQKDKEKEEQQQKDKEKEQQRQRSSSASSTSSTYTALASETTSTPPSSSRSSSSGNDDAHTVDLASRAEDSEESIKLITNNDDKNYTVNFMDNIINEAGELWRKWLWLEMVDDN